MRQIGKPTNRTPLLEYCVALIRHVVQQLVHLRVFENERLPTLQADQNVTSDFHKPPSSQTTFAQWSPVFS